MDDVDVDVDDDVALQRAVAVESVMVVLAASVAQRVAVGTLIVAVLPCV